MKITLLTTGSRGDVQPFLALGVALKRAGHIVTVAGPSYLADWICGYGFIFRGTDGVTPEIMKSVTVREAMTADNPLKVLLSFYKIKKLVVAMQGQLYDACEGADMIVFHPGAVIGAQAARQLGIPAILATPFPMTPTKDYPSLIFYTWPRWGRLWNRISHFLFQSVMSVASSSPVKQFWKTRFGESPPLAGNPFRAQGSSRFPTLVGVSTQVFAKPRDWPANVHATGYWFLDAEPGWQPSAELNAFLDDGAPPIYIGFGSVGSQIEAEIAGKIVVDALQLVRKRGVIATGWGGILAKNLPETIHLLESAPHAWLFPRMAAVVHHGGAGTTAAGFRAGVPSVFVPHGNDQFAWGYRAWELGVAAKPIPRKDLTAKKLADAINRSLKDDILNASSALGQRIRAEDGLSEAVKWIEITAKQEHHH
jgi:sterol 3beta-glucosyltransferase